MINRGKHNILGVMVSAADYEMVVRRIVQAANSRTSLVVSAAAVHAIMEGALSEEHKYRLNHFDLVVPDGQPVRWTLNLLHRARLKDRVYGPSLAVRTLQAAERFGLSVFFYGGDEGLLSAIRRNVTSQYPGLRIAGTESSKFRRLLPGEKQQIAQRIFDSGASLVFVGLGCPRQDVWAYEFRGVLPMPVVCVGGAFGILARRSPQAPQWMQDRGLEWLYRLSREPRRLWRRYLLFNPAYVGLIAMQAFRLKRFDILGRCPGDELAYG